MAKTQKNKATAHHLGLLKVAHSQAFSWLIMRLHEMYFARSLLCNWVANVLQLYVVDNITLKLYLVGGCFFYHNALSCFL